MVLESAELDRIKRNACVLSTDEKKVVEKTIKDERTARIEAANTRKKVMADLEIERKKNERPSDLEQVS